MSNRPTGSFALRWAKSWWQLSRGGEALSCIGPSQVIPKRISIFIGTIGRNKEASARAPAR